MDQDTVITFVVLIFAAVFLMAQVIVVPTFGTGSRERKQIKKRLQDVASSDSFKDLPLVRQKYLKKLSPFERWFESLSVSQRMTDLIEQSGRDFPSYRLILICIASGLGAGLFVWLFFQHWLGTLVVTLVFFWLPIVKLKRDRKQRLERFEEQLPEALEMMARALRTGYPFLESFAYIGEEMADPIAHEFAITYEEINYGRDLGVALNYLLARVPCVSLFAMSAALLIQRETGGNLAEVLTKISQVLRARFRFHRRVKTMSAEGRFTAWVLGLMPYFMFISLNIISPAYFDPLYESPIGYWLLGIAFVLFVIGTIWCSKIVNIDI